MIEVPSLFAEYGDNELKLKNGAHEELLRKIILNNNLLINLMPVGSIIFIDVNQTGISLPDQTYWQECDGSEITNPLSPLRTQGIFERFTPDLKNKYPRGANTVDGNSSGGSFNKSIAHSHGGYTSTNGAFGGFLDHKGPRTHAVAHRHEIGVGLGTGNEIVSPKYFYCIAYMKVV